MKKYFTLCSMLFIGLFAYANTGGSARTNLLLSSFSMQTLPQWITYVSTVFIVLIALTVGYQLAVYLKKKNTIIDDGPANTLVAAVMGLLAFILAFAFSVTTNRFDTRKGLLLEEVNTIETLYMRVDLIPEQYQAQVKKDIIDALGGVLLHDKQPFLTAKSKQQEEVKSTIYGYVRGDNGRINTTR